LEKLMSPRSRRQGFSLIELIVSIGIVGTSLILLVGIFTVLLNGSQKASDLTSGSAIADGLLSQQVYQIMAVDSNRVTFFKTAYSTPQVINGGTYSLNNTVFFYKIYVQDVALGATLHNSSTDGSTGQTLLKRLDVVLWWSDETAGSASSWTSLTMNQQTGRGQGVQQVHQVRVLWPDSSY